MGSQFDGIADVYDRVVDDVPFRACVEQPSVLAELGDVAGRRVLDLGCGSGIYSRLLATRGASVTGVDQSAGMIEQARRTEADNPLGIRYVLGDAATDRSLAAAFDLVIGAYLLPYAATPESLAGMCTTIHRALDSGGGRFVGVTMNPDYSSAPGYYRPFGVDVSTPGGARPGDGDPVSLHVRVGGRPLDLTAYYWTREAQERALTAAGFSTVGWRLPTCAPECDEARFADFVAIPHIVIVTADS